jgi:hypothetical protein
LIYTVYVRGDYLKCHTPAQAINGIKDRASEATVIQTANAFDE